MRKALLLLPVILISSSAAAGPFTPSPPELMRVFEGYTKKMDIDPNTCSLGVWDSGVFLSTPKATYANRYATCPVKATYHICTKLAPEIGNRMDVQNGCVTGLNRVSFLPILAISPLGGHFVVVHETDGKPLRLTQQLTIGFGDALDYCEISAQLIDENGEALAKHQFHNFVTLLGDPGACVRADASAPKAEK